MWSYWDDSVFCSPFLPVTSLDAMTGQDEDGALVPIAECIPDPAADLEAEYETHEAAAAVAAFVCSLAPRAHEVIRRVFWEGQAQATVARDLGLSGAAISKLIARVRLSGGKRLAHYRHSTLLS